MPRQQARQTEPSVNAALGDLLKGIVLSQLLVRDCHNPFDGGAVASTVCYYFYEHVDAEKTVQGFDGGARKTCGNAYLCEHGLSLGSPRYSLLKLPVLTRCLEDPNEPDIRNSGFFLPFISRQAFSSDYASFVLASRRNSFLTTGAFSGTSKLKSIFAIGQILLSVTQAHRERRECQRCSSPFARMFLCRLAKQAQQGLPRAIGPNFQRILGYVTGGREFAKGVPLRVFHQKREIA